MIATELMIGNWVAAFDKYYQMSDINTDYPFVDSIEFGVGALDWKDVKPIPLTEEILLKAGFEVEHKEGSQTNFRVYRLGEFTYNTNHGWWFHNHLAHEPKHLHQLQNLIFSLTGKELKINL